MFMVMSLADFLLHALSSSFSSQNLGPELSVSSFVLIIHITEFKANACTCKLEFYSTF